MAPLLELQNITRRYPGVVALDDVSFSLNGGEVHCLVGENGAGKSTLVKILSGALAADEGILSIDGRQIEVHSPADAQALGIGIIHQDFKLVPELSVAQNILLGHEPLKRRSLFIDYGQMHEKARGTLRQLGEEIDTTAKVGHLGIAGQQIVEIARALSRNVRILAMDEPTASLTKHEIANLFRVIHRLKSEGVGIMYISHRLEEVFDIGDKVTVLRDGKVVQSCVLTELDRRSLISLMVGRELEDEYPAATLVLGTEILRVEHLVAERLTDINLQLFRGEILGIVGLVGAGRTELARVLFGADPVISGKILLDGKPIAPKSPHDAINHGIGLLTEDRNRLGLVLPMNVRENISLAGLDPFLTGPFINRKAEEAAAQRSVEELQIKPQATEAEVETLSGGNRQKVVLARWLSTKARLLIFDEPTVGIDVGAKYEIYTIINRLAAAGVGIMVISSDLPELLGVCTRIAVMCRGRITGIIPAKDATQERIMALATDSDQ